MTSNSPNAKAHEGIDTPVESEGAPSQSPAGASGPAASGSASSGLPTSIPPASVPVAAIPGDVRCKALALTIDLLMYSQNDTADSTFGEDDGGELHYGSVSSSIFNYRVENGRTYHAV